MKCEKSNKWLILIVEGHGEKKTKPVGTIAFVYLSNYFKKNTICYLI